MWEVIGILSSGLWLAYGYLRNDIILTIGAAVLVISYAILIFQKFLYGEVNKNCCDGNNLEILFYILA